MTSKHQKTETKKGIKKVLLFVGNCPRERHYKRKRNSRGKQHRKSDFLRRVKKHRIRGVTKRNGEDGDKREYERGGGVLGSGKI